MTGFLYAERLVMEELSGESYHMLLVPRHDHGILFCYPKVVGCTQKATLLGTISARLCKHVPEERRAQGAEGVVYTSFLSTSQSHMHQNNLGLFPMVPLTA